MKPQHLLQLIFLFSISSLSAQIITSPNGGEQWAAGSTQNISWNVSTISSISTQYSLLYSIDKGYTWVNIASVSGGSGTYSWTVPNQLSSKCLVKISESKSVFDQSNSLFSITSSATAINNNESAVLSINVYPNPATDFVSIVNNDPSNVISAVTIYDVLGNVAAQFNADQLMENNMRIDVKDLAMGTYSVMLATSSSIICKKIVIVK